MKKVKIITLLSFFCMFSMTLWADNNTSQVDFNKQVITALYTQLKKADSDVDSSILPDLQNMQSDGVISIKELQEEFWEDLISPEFISEMHENSFLDKGIQYADISNQEAIDKFLAETNTTMYEMSKESYEYSKLTLSICEMTATIWGWDCEKELKDMEKNLEFLNSL